MAKKIDLVALSAILIVLLFCFGVVLFKNIWLSLTVASAVSVAVVFSIDFFTHSKKRVNASDFATWITLKGNDYLIEILKTTLKNDKIESGSNYILLENSAIFSFFKYGNVSASEVLSVRKTLENRNVSKVFVFANGIDKQAYKIATLLNIRLKLVKTSSLVRFLEKHNALPEVKKQKAKISFPAIFATIFSRSNFKAYTFSGVVLLATSFITPLKIYYLVSGTVCLLLSIFSLAFGNGNIFAITCFKELENAAKNDCVSDENSYCGNSTESCDRTESGDDIPPRDNAQKHTGEESHDRDTSGED